MTAGWIIQPGVSHVARGQRVGNPWFSYFIARPAVSKGVAASSCNYLIALFKVNRGHLWKGRVEGFWPESGLATSPALCYAHTCLPVDHFHFEAIKHSMKNRQIYKYSVLLHQHLRTDDKPECVCVCVFVCLCLCFNFMLGHEWVDVVVIVIVVVVGSGGDVN